MKHQEAELFTHPPSHHAFSKDIDKGTVLIMAHDKNITDKK